MTLYIGWYFAAAAFMVDIVLLVWILAEAFIEEYRYRKSLKRRG